MVKHCGIPKHRKEANDKNADGGYNTSLKSHTGDRVPTPSHSQDEGLLIVGADLMDSYTDGLLLDGFTRGSTHGCLLTFDFSHGINKRSGDASCCHLPVLPTVNAR